MTSSLVSLFLLAAVIHVVVGAPPQNYRPSGSFGYQPSAVGGFQAVRPQVGGLQAAMPQAGTPQVTSMGDGLQKVSISLPAHILAGMTEKQKQEYLQNAMAASGQQMQGTLIDPETMMTNGRYDPDKAMMHELGMSGMQLPKTPVEQATNVKTATRAVDEPEPTYMPGQDANKQFNLPFMERHI